MPKGMMLAAGRGTRLGPLTDTLPKPLIPVANRPVMAQGICCLRQVGIRDICANVSYRAQQIMDEFVHHRIDGVLMHWLVEETASGTAGGMKKVQCHLDDDEIVVIAGDAMLDIDIALLLAAHREHGAFASIATIPVEDASQYGVVITDADRRVVQFQEKPDPGTEISRQANTGVYIFDPGIFNLIPPAGTFCDFARNVFPEILRQGLPFYAHPVQGYWTDIGNPGDYLRANMDFLAGHIRVEGYGNRVGNNLIATTAEIAGSRLEGCIIGDSVTLPAGCELTNCVVWPQTTLHEALHLSSAVLTPHGIFAIEGKEARELVTAVGAA